MHDEIASIMFAPKYRNVSGACHILQRMACPYLSETNYGGERTMRTLYSGELAPKTGDYGVYAETGELIGSVRVKKGDKLPPVDNCYFLL